MRPRRPLTVSRRCSSLGATVATSMAMAITLAGSWINGDEMLLLSSVDAVARLERAVGGVLERIACSRCRRG